MRTLVQLELRRRDEGALEAATSWFEEAGFRPVAITLTDSVKSYLRSTPEPQSNELPTDHTTDLFHAFEILSSIPLAEEERHLALNTAKLVVKFDDLHGNVVWGLVCIDAQWVNIRWRHKLSRSLERATEHLIACVWEAAGPDKVFREFPEGATVPVREPRSTNEAYVGVILARRSRRRERARAEKGTERKLAFGGLLATAMSLLAGYVLFYSSTPGSYVLWLSGFFDRLATTALATSAVAYLQYWFHLRDLERKPIIDWM